MNVRIVNGFFQKGTHTARVLSPKTIYPRETILFSDGVYIAAEDLCFSFVRNADPNSEEEVYSELQWLTPSEIRTYGAIMLSVDRERGYSAFYPYPIGITLECEPGPDLLSWVSEFVKPLLINALLKPEIRNPGEVVTYANPYRSHSDIPMPPIAGGLSYEFQHNVVDLELARSLFEEIVPNDDLVIRGIGTYIKAAMLQRHYQFFEEALNTLYISLECSFRMVLQVLEDQGKVNPTAKDAAEFIHEVLHDTYRLERYFEEDYERRIISFHPESRFGVYPYPPMSADDYYDLFRELQEVYQYLLTGYVHPWRLERAGLIE